MGICRYLSKWPSISNNIDELKAKVTGMSNSEMITDVLVKFTPENGYTLDKKCLFKKEKAVPYIIDSKTGSKHYLNDKVIEFDSYTDINGSTNNGIPCIYHKYEMITDEIDDAYLEITYKRLFEPETNSIISNGDIKMDIGLGHIGRINNNGISDSFTTDYGFDIDISFFGHEMQMNWKSKNGDTFPDFLKNLKYNDNRPIHQILQL